MRGTIAATVRSVDVISLFRDTRCGGTRPTNFSGLRNDGFVTGWKQWVQSNLPPQRPGWRSEQIVVTDPIRILCVEDHPVYREGLRTIIGYEPDMLMVGHAANAVQAIAEFRRLRPDVTLMDFRLPGANGVDVLIAIRGEFPQARVIMLTTSDGDADIQRAMRAGASAYILKSMPMEELLGVIRSVHSGRRHIPPEVAAKLAEFMGDEDLTARELEVLRLIREGYRNKQIADQLAISENTVNFHIKNLMENCAPMTGPMQSPSRCGGACCKSDVVTPTRNCRELATIFGVLRHTGSAIT